MCSEQSSPDIEDLPTISCSRCNRTWKIDYELEELSAGNRAIEQFALDHERHTGHFPDDVTPWIASCRRCPDRERYLTEHPTRRWAITHTRHTGHSVELRDPSGNSASITANDAGWAGKRDVEK